MRIRLQLVLAILLTLCGAEVVGAEVLVRWDAADIPPRESLGLTTVVIPIERAATVKQALARGYDVYVEVDAAKALTTPIGRAAGVVLRGRVTAQRLALMKKQLEARGVRVLALDSAAKWPHIRTNWVTKNNEVLQVTGRSAQPWIENNAARIRINAAARRTSSHAATYAWKPITVADNDEGPRLENYLVAIAETGSFGGTLVLPMHARFQQQLLSGHPEARADWSEIRRYLDFYSWNLLDRYQPLANIVIAASVPDASFEMMNLLARHNLPFTVVEPAQLSAKTLSGIDLAIVADSPSAAQLQTLAAFARAGGTVLLTTPPADAPWRSQPPTQKTAERASYQVGTGRVVEATAAIANPDAFALDMRQILGRDRRIIDVWNGITILAAPYRDPGGTTLMVTAVNYAHQPMPIQLRVRGTFSTAYYESPEESAALIPRQHRDGYTEFLLPALRIGGRVFLSR